MKPNAIDLQGQSFGRYIVLVRVPHRRRDATWRCRCQCGQERDVNGSLLRCGSAYSCGCYRRPRKPKEAKEAKWRTRAHGSWSAMRARTRPGYSLPPYAGSGIKCCDRWRKYDNFLADMGARPHGMTLDRIDSHGDYEPGNCRWATPKEQRSNCSDNVWMVIFGERKTKKQWSEDRRCATTYTTFCKRLHKGIEPYTALTTPTMRARRAS